MRLRWRGLARWRVLPIVLGAGLGSLLLLDLMYPLQLPDPAADYARVVTDRDGTPLRVFPDRDGVWRYAIGVDDVSPSYLEALVTYEDRWFWKHPGINPFAILRAAWQNTRSGRVVSGGSTFDSAGREAAPPAPAHAAG